MGSAFDSLVCWIRWSVKTAGSYMVDAIEFVIDAIAFVINGVLSLLPNDPRGSGEVVQPAVLGLFNYIVPMGAIMVEFGVLMAAWIIYRVLQWALAFAKADY